MSEDSPTKRALSLDALRGFAILTMFLSGLLPFYENTLPAWMYHAQMPPPEHSFNPNIPGITWVDLVFPFFLFSMGAAFPFALSKRLELGDSKFKMVGRIIFRGILLAGFAIYIQHIKPYALEASPSTSTWLIALLGFALLFPVLMRFPKEWDKKKIITIRAVGIIAIVVLLSLLKYPDDKTFSLYRSDIIILVLANTALFGSLIWLFTRNNWLLRIGILGILLAFRLAHTEAVWADWLWNATPFPWFYKFAYLQYLFIVIPGTIIGDMILSWMKAPNHSEQAYFSSSKNAILAFGLILIIIVTLTGLKGRFLIATNISLIILCVGIAYLFKNAASQQEQLLKKIFLWGFYFLILGLAFEPFEGGIKKDHATISYYFVSTAMSIFLLIAFHLIIESLGKRKYLNLLIANGQNPMIAYAGISNLIPPILALTYIGELLNYMVISPWLGFVKGLLVTLALAVMVAQFTKRKVHLKT
jgi:predicted acyltransferase